MKSPRSLRIFEVVTSKFYAFLVVFHTFSPIYACFSVLAGIIPLSLRNGGGAFDTVCPPLFLQVVGNCPLCPRLRRLCKQVFSSFLNPDSDRCRMTGGKLDPRYCGGSPVIVYFYSIRRHTKITQQWRLVHVVGNSLRSFWPMTACRGCLETIRVRIADKKMQLIRN